MIDRNKIVYYLYNIESLDKQIKSFESDIIDTGQVGVKAWQRVNIILLALQKIKR